MSFFQSRDGTQLHERAWPAQGQSRAVVVIVHGYGEHIGRYDATARALGEAGFTVRGFDLRGHGQSGGIRGFCRRFSEYLEDVDAEIVRARGETLPLFLLGHSFGGLIAAHWALAHPSELTGLVLTSPFFGLALPVPAAKVLAGKVFSKIYPSMALPTGLKGSDVTRDPELQALYESDPLNNKNATARWFTEAAAAQVELERRAGEITLPVLLIAGGADGVASPKQAKVVFDRLGARDKTLQLLDGQRHEVLNELLPDRTRTVGEIAEWLRAHAGADDGKLRAG
jgi:alpha-beta hydrolase superfamily lysophospholipase